MPAVEHQQHRRLTEGEQRELEALEKMMAYLLLSQSQRMEKRNAYRNQPRVRSRDC